MRLDCSNCTTRPIRRVEEEERQGIFIKNIENVQGDERDVIIFSIAYAKDSRGKLSANFGLLNQKGGENRLNVAVTRAKKRVVVVCSFDPVELQVDQALNPGPKLFKQYLLYAQAVHRAHAEDTESVLKGLSGGGEADVGSDTPELKVAALAELVGTDLQAKGYRIVRNIGDTNYKLDLAVVDPEKGFLLGIECEGQHYFSGKSSKEREVYRSRLLEQRGWKLHRVWARNFYLDREKEINKIVSKIQEVNR